MKSGAERLVQLDRAYVSIPPVPCRPGCSDCCGPIMMTRLEWDRIAQRIGHAPEGDTHAMLAVAHATGDCSLLVDGRCSVYDIRPMVCRLYATGPAGLVCPHECKSERRLSNADGHVLMAKAHRIGARGLEVRSKYSEGNGSQS
jgi:hypothetical protein